MLAGAPTQTGLAARISVCLNGSYADPLPWQRELAARGAQQSTQFWRDATVRSLGDWIAHDDAFVDAHRAAARAAPLIVRRYFARPNAKMGAPPLGLHDAPLPSLPDPAALAQWLSISVAGLWRLTRAQAWQRRAALIDQHYRYRLLPKRAGGWRLLEVPQPHLMALQRRLLSGLIDLIAPHEAACAYRRGASVIGHAARHADQAVLMRFDLQDFFTAIDARRVRAMFHALGYPDPVARTLAALTTTATPEPVLARLREDGSLDWARAQRLRGAHLPQGAPCSPALANLCAFGLDLRLDGLAQVLGARYSRYADDIVFSGPPGLASVGARIEDRVMRIVAEQGFCLNHRKTRVQRAGRRQSVCGVVVNRHPNLPRDEFDRLKAILHRCIKHGPSAENRAQHAHWQAYLRGRVAWAMQINPVKAARLALLFERIEWTG